MDREHPAAGARRSARWHVDLLVFLGFAALQCAVLVPYLTTAGGARAGAAAAVAVGSALPMLVVRRAPVPALTVHVVVGIVLPAASGLLVLTPAVGFPVFAVAAAHRGVVTVTWVVAVCGWLLTLGPLDGSRLWQPNGWASTVTVVVVVVAAGAAGTAQRRGRLRQQAHLRRLSDAEVRTTVEAERGRVRAELDRLVGSGLDALQAACDEVGRAAALGRAAPACDAVRRTARSVLDDTRALLVVLRDRPVHDCRTGNPAASPGRPPVDGPDVACGAALVVVAAVLDACASTGLPAAAMFRLPDPASCYAVLDAAAAAVVLRRRHPTAVLVLTGAGAVASARIGWPPPVVVAWLLPVVLLLAAARWTRPSRSAPVAAATAAVHAHLAPVSGPPGGAVTVVLVCGIAWAAGQWARYCDADLDTARRRRHEQRIRAAVHRERLHLAREIHDDVAHHVAAVAVWANAAVGAAEREPQHVADSCAPLATAVRRARAAFPGVAAVPGRALPVADRVTVDELVGPLRDAGAEVTVSVGGTAPTPGDAAEHIAHRIVQEAVTNVARHAGPVRTDVRVHRDGEHLTVEVRNALPDGPAAPAGTGFGLLGMRERADAVGGRCSAGPRDGAWVVTAELPRTPPRAPSGTPGRPRAVPAPRPGPFGTATGPRPTRRPTTPAP